MSFDIHISLSTGDDTSTVAVGRAATRQQAERQVSMAKLLLSDSANSQVRLEQHRELFNMARRQVVSSALRMVAEQVRAVVDDASAVSIRDIENEPVNAFVGVVDGSGMERVVDLSSCNNTKLGLALRALFDVEGRPPQGRSRTYELPAMTGLPKDT